MLDLTHALQNHRSLVGNECEKLGKNRGLFKTKTFISYDRDKGWNTLKLNLVQLFLRKVFGFYSSTHLDKVVRGFIRANQNGEISDKSAPMVKAFEAKIHTLWDKTFSRSFPQDPLFTSRNKMVAMVTEGDDLYRHFSKQYAAITPLLTLDGIDSPELETKVNELIRDLPEFIHFYQLHVNGKELQERLKRNTDLAKTTISDNFVKLKRKEIEPDYFKAIILGVLKKSYGVIKKGKNSSAI